MCEKKYQEGFNKGYKQLSLKDEPQARIELNAALGLNNRVSLWNYRNGTVEPKASQAAAIEAIFAKYGITDVWGQ